MGPPRWRPAEDPGTAAPPVAQHARNPLPDFFEQFITRRMAERIVDFLEAIKVEEEKGRFAIAPLAGRQRAGGRAFRRGIILPARLQRCSTSTAQKPARLPAHLSYL